MANIERTFFQIEVCDTCGRHVMDANHAVGICQNGPTHWVDVVRAATHQGAVEALEEIRRVVAIEDSGDVDPRHQYQQVKRVQEIVSTVLGGR